MSGRGGCVFNLKEVHSFCLFDLGAFIKKSKGRKERAKIQALENNIGNHIEINHFLPSVKRRNELRPIFGHSRVHLCLSGLIRTLTKKLLIWVAVISQ
ncbi:hypothetical protein AVEN_255557-1 [Araneus ventricosus]|uniref:Uncharacterized protein n=1 Tax=Araneus ventricosus TaxID=182803 RepID=A0A4Y2JKE4_ARAVE|nr:hypothetical protein AVEN_255557-1 [Araneus ventricosus]